MDLLHRMPEEDPLLKEKLLAEQPCEKSRRGCSSPTNFPIIDHIRAAAAAHPADLAAGQQLAIKLAYVSPTLVDWLLR